MGAVEVIVANICGNTWPNEVSQAACRVLSALSRVWKEGKGGKEKASKGGSLTVQSIDVFLLWQWS